MVVCAVKVTASLTSGSSLLMGRRMGAFEITSGLFDVYFVRLNPPSATSIFSSLTRLIASLTVGINFKQSST